MDIDPDQAVSALELFEAEKERRIQARIDGGELRVIGRSGTAEDDIVVGSEDEIEEALAKAKAAAVEKYGNNPPLYFDYLVVVTGVPRGPDSYRYASGPDEEPEASAEQPVGDAPQDVPAYCAPPHPSTYVFTTTRPADDDGYAGEILDGYFEVTDGELVLTDIQQRFISSHRLMEGEDPYTVAKRMLKKSTDNLDFERPLRYRSGGYA
jgi:hypothetical protein